MYLVACQSCRKPILSHPPHLRTKQLRCHVYRPSEASSKCKMHAERFLDLHATGGRITQGQQVIRDDSAASEEELVVEHRHSALIRVDVVLRLNVIFGLGSKVKEAGQRFLSRRQRLKLVTSFI